MLDHHRFISGHYQGTLQSKVLSCQKRFSSTFSVAYATDTSSFLSSLPLLETFSGSAGKPNSSSMEYLMAVSSVLHLELHASSGRAVQLMQLKFLFLFCTRVNSICQLAEVRSMPTHIERKRGGIFLVVFTLQQQQFFAIYRRIAESTTVLTSGFSSGEERDHTCLTLVSLCLCILDRYWRTMYISELF